MWNRRKQPVRVELDARAVGQRIRQARRRRGWAQKELARIVSVKAGTVACWESGFRIPTRDGLVALGYALRRKVDWILFGGRDYWYRRRPPGKD